MRAAITWEDRDTGRLTARLGRMAVGSVFPDWGKEAGFLVFLPNEHSIDVVGHIETAKTVDLAKRAVEALVARWLSGAGLMDRATVEADAAALPLFAPE